MRGIQVKQYVSGPLDLAVSDLPEPTPGPDQYTIAIHATATNFFDLLQIRGKYQHQPPLPWISGSEFSGVILAVPSSGKSRKFKVGDKVFGAAQGGYATKVCAREEQLRPVPKGWSCFEAAGLFVTMPTSYAGLVTRCNLKAGDWVLVHAAAGGVGLAAVQIAKALGATVIATAGTAHKLSIAKRFGADYTVDYRDDSWPLRVKELTPNKRGVDIVYDPVGLIDKSTKCIAWNGRLLVIGFAGGPIEKMATNKILLKNISVVGLHWGAYALNEPQKIGEVWDDLFKLFESRKVVGTNYTDREYVGLETVPEALKALGERDTWGKVVVKSTEHQQGKHLGSHILNQHIANVTRLLCRLPSCLLSMPGRRAAHRSREIATRRRRRETEQSGSSSVDVSPNAEDAIAEDDLCPVCRLLLFQPVTTGCNHSLCRTCMARWAEVSISAPMTIVRVDEEPQDFDAATGLEARCPMCRTYTTASLDHPLADRLQSTYPAVYGERGSEEADDGDQHDSIQTITVYIGNSHELIQPAEQESHNIHRWTFFVRPSRNDIIDEVQIFLHPTFRPSRIIRQRPPYELSRIGWGYFTIVAGVILKPGYSWVSSDAEDSRDGAPKGMLRLDWTLDFTSFGGTGAKGRHRLKVKNERGWADVDEEAERDEAEWSRTVRQIQRDGRWEPPPED
ncbi:hypothetical protein BAUCODRAFT_22388 [Baudoinia panamericana UAMH 10762]|uniref:Uncharacterized protein n=1 Tax=Baudoinia panamericana (strain UAMH 10762) TaxID=717646 RepID=M2NIA6_BAUPA|nr:uncharacterized protein BAUCODRAFT_22388 [Baudoinia panamericana UAMH 10762]EMC99099.1 hypothetical protein BAUCODRAFT_22388 [Baudoinia panamericana UAMH 10762]